MNVVGFASGETAPWRPPRLTALDPRSDSRPGLRDAGDDHALALLRGLLAESR